MKPAQPALWGGVPGLGLIPHPTCWGPGWEGGGGSTAWSCCTQKGPQYCFLTPGALSCL